MVCWEEIESNEAVRMEEAQESCCFLMLRKDGGWLPV